MRRTLRLEVFVEVRGPLETRPPHSAADALGICGSAVRSRLIALTGEVPRVRRGTHANEADSEHSACDDGEFAQ
ncbi:hypothetical protein [Streptomyces sp. NPDC088254]|uniref:hypothetical protein n=1 Tax=Streptomyces sp. NPDC088254 TaxID=3365847 RepID=UPI0037FB7C42